VATNKAPELLIRGYGPLVLLVVAFGLVALLAPPVTPQLAAETAPGDDPGAGPTASEQGTNEGQAERAVTDTGDGEGAPARPADPAASTGSDQDESSASDDGDAPAGDGAAAGGGGGEAGACEDRDLQIPGDPYSPPCVHFEGDNPGATSRGVTGDAVVISVRLSDEPGFQDTLADLAGADIADSPDDVRRTVEGLADYLNERFELYGRELVPEFYIGRGSPTDELLGRGQEEAQADAITAAQEIEAFAELNAATEPFAAALSDQGVVNVGAPFVSREWFAQRRPYAWSVATDCSIAAESIAHWSIVRIGSQPTAEYARDDFQGEPRRIGLVTPENPYYQQCLDAGVEIFEAEAHEDVDIVASLSYALDLNTISNQAANLVARLQSEGVTTILCNCDPVMPVFLTARATEQDYWPEWNISGVGFTDQDLIGQLFDQRQWARAYGISYVGETLPQQATIGYHAYQQVRDDEPAFMIDSIYYSLYLLALGIQSAGPELTPETFAQGLYGYPGGTGPAGTWGFGPDNHTPTEDFREVHWDPEAVSPYNSQPGRYVDPNPGQRYRFGEVPEGPPNVPW
jgi:hypothetical protein